MSENKFKNHPWIPEFMPPFPLEHTYKQSVVQENFEKNDFEKYEQNNKIKKQFEDNITSLNDKIKNAKK